MYLQEVVLKKNIHEDTIVIFTPIVSPLNFYKGNLEDKINNERLDLINKVNNSLKLYNKNNFIYFDIIETLSSFNEKDLFIDESNSLNEIIIDICNN